MAFCCGHGWGLFVKPGAGTGAGKGWGQDGIIDAGDLSEIDNDILNSVFGYVKTDINGDEIVDASDLSAVDNNLGIVVIRP